MGSQSNLKQMLLEALQASINEPPVEKPQGITTASNPRQRRMRTPEPPAPLELSLDDQTLDNGDSVYSLLLEEEEVVGVSETDTFTTPAVMSTLSDDLVESANRLRQLLAETQYEEAQLPDWVDEPLPAPKNGFNDTLSERGMVPDAQTETLHPAGAPSSSEKTQPIVTLEHVNSGGSMADLSGYKDLSKAPMSFGDDDMPMASMSSLSPEPSFDRSSHHMSSMAGMSSAPQHFVQPEVSLHEVDTEFSGNVKTLIRLVNELPEGVTKQTGAQIIRLTMEAMGISMEDVLSEAQSAQSEMLDAVRANIKKIEEYKTVIRKLETDIKYYQGKANELSEIIDLFILSNTTGQKMSMPDDMSH